MTIATDTVHLDAAGAERLGIERAGTYAILSVADTGTGMDQQTQNSIFEPFFTTKEVGKGSGLGLATAYGIAKQHGGAIAVESAENEGSTFRVYLPRVEGLDIEEPGPTEDDQVSVDGPETVLLVEDEDMVREVAVRALEAHGYTVLTASHPVEAEHVYAQHHEEIKLLITDIVMPGYNGRELYFRLNMRDPALKVLFMSGYAEQALGDDGSTTLGGFFLHKPFTPSDLLARVRQLLDA